MRARIRLLPCDRPTDKGDIYRSGGIQIENKELPVWLETDEDPIGLVGKAKAWIEAGWLLADLDVLDTRIPDPMPRILYAVPVLMYPERDGAMVKSALVTGVSLTITMPSWPSRTLAAQVAS